MARTRTLHWQPFSGGAWKTRLICLALGVLFIAFALGLTARAQSDYAFISLDAESHEFSLQAGSVLSFNATYGVIAPQPLLIKTVLPSVPEVKVDGSAVPTLTNISFSRVFTVKVSPVAQPGTYVLPIVIQSQFQGQALYDQEVIRVNVVPNQGGIFTTTPYYNVPPLIANAALSKQAVALTRNEHAFIDVSFRNIGSASDFELYVNPFTLPFDVSFDSPVALHVGLNETFHTVLSVDTNAGTPFGTYVFTVMARDIPSGKTFFLGTVQVIVFPVYTVDAFVPFESIEVPLNGSQDVVLTIHNTSLAPQAWTLVSSADFAVLDQRQVSLEAGSQAEIQVHVKPVKPGLLPVRITLNGPSSRVVEFLVIVPTPVQGTPNSVAGTGLTGLVSGASAVLLGLLVILLIALLVYVIPRYREHQAKAEQAEKETLARIGGKA
ncbi:MAG: hypothetical protein HY393_00740 [Candidatus Diapherotrites archaeon]|nr:hypothetical protein [Candidatus Diapherotrites archaeon]